MQQKPQRTVTPLPTVRRFPVYLRLLLQLKSQGREDVSATTIAQKLNLEAILVRKDLSLAGVVGRPRIGFEIAPLIEKLESFLGWSDPAKAFLIGAGHLGSALLQYEPLRQQGLDIIAAFDRDPNLIGETIANKPVLAIEKLPSLARRMHVHTAVLTVPASVAQEVADLAIDGGICGIWNFAPTQLDIREGVFVHHEDLSASSAILTVQVSKLLHARNSSAADSNETTEEP